MYGREFGDLDAFTDFVSGLIAENVKNGSVCIKNAIAYDRTVNFKETEKDKAAKVFSSDASAEDIRHFQDYLFLYICRVAAELDVPVQCHTGLGCLDGTRAIGLNEIIEKNPETKFVLFHASFPWTNDVLALLHNYPNVYVDICWLPLLSPTAAVNTLHELIEVGTSDKICWGCDTWTSEESYGARLAVNSVLTDVLDAKVSSGYLCANGAEQVARNILFNNAKTLYKL
jgi:predicted TIM-barrel fold metal-dependent hydrolase